MKTKPNFLLRLMVMMGIFLSLTVGLTQTVHADTCTWLGISTNWNLTSNWSCGHVPTTSDDVVIADQANDPLITISPTTINVNTLTINSGAELIDDSATLFIYATSFVNNGTLKTMGMDSAMIRVFSPIDNNFNVYANGGVINFENGGTHSGNYFGLGKITFIGTAHTFSSTSSISAKKIEFINTLELNFPGQFNQHLEDSRLIIDNADVTLSNLTNLKVGSVMIVSGSLTIGLSGAATGPLSVPNSTSFVGTGTVAGDLLNSGTVSPGTSPGTINVTGNYTQDSTGTLAMEIGGTMPDTGYDQLIVSGTASLDGELEVRLIDPFTPTLGDSFTLMTYDSHTGTFATETLQALNPGLEWAVHYGETALTLTVINSGGTIEGTVTYTGNEVGETVTIGYFTDPHGPPDASVNVPYTDGAYPYSFSGLAEGTYAICALMDLNDSGDPDRNEPYACYDDNSDGEPDPITISAPGQVISDIDFLLEDTLFIYLPLILR